MKQPFRKGFFVGGAIANAMDDHQGPLPGRALGDAPRRRAAAAARRDRDKRYPKPDGKLTFDKLSSVFLSGNATRDDAPTTSASRSSCRARSPRRGSGCARRRSTRSPRTRPRHGHVDLIVNPSNCVQCGAITAKGGRLTPPEGGDGPLYQIT